MSACHPLRFPPLGTPYIGPATRFELPQETDRCHGVCRKAFSPPDLDISRPTIGEVAMISSKTISTAGQILTIWPV